MPSDLNLLILTDVETLEKAPLFFSLYGLTMRASGAELMVTGRGGDPGVKAAVNFKYPFNSVRVAPPEVVKSSKQAYQEWKLKLALELSARKHVIWPDVDFSDWKAETAEGHPNIVILDMAKLINLSKVSRMGGSF